MMGALEAGLKPLIRFASPATVAMRLNASSTIQNKKGDKGIGIPLPLTPLSLKKTFWRIIDQNGKPRRGNTQLNPTPPFNFKAHSS